MDPINGVNTFLAMTMALGAGAGIYLSDTQRRSKKRRKPHVPHQGKKEMERRRKQMGKES